MTRFGASVLCQDGREIELLDHLGRVARLMALGQPLLNRWLKQEEVAAVRNDPVFHCFSDQEGVIRIYIKIRAQSSTGC